MSLKRQPLFPNAECVQCIAGKLVIGGKGVGSSLGQVFKGLDPEWSVRPGVAMRG